MTNKIPKFYSTNIFVIAMLLLGLHLGMNTRSPFNRLLSNFEKNETSSFSSSFSSKESRPSAANVAGSNVLVGAGDIGRCDSNNDEATAKLLDSIPGTVFTLGDNVYDDGTAQEFRDCYDPTWGRHKARTKPVSGNHDYHVAGAAGYYDYFGEAAGDRTKGYYSYNIENWHIVVLNSECGEIGGCNSSSLQTKWLQEDLAANPSSCLLAYWHKPRFSSGYHGNSTASKDFWPILYAAGADVILNGHDHEYERFALQDPNGVADPVNGIREFVVGTGGTPLVPFSTIAANSEVRNASTYGVLKLTLLANSYEWQFIPVAGSTFSDSGTGSCRGIEPTSTPSATPTAMVTDTPTAVANSTPTATSANSTTTATPSTPTTPTVPTPTPTPSALCAAGIQSASQRITSGADDAEEYLESSAVDIGSTDLELINDGGSVPQIVGLRFPALAVPQGATITNATIEFEVDEQDTGQTSLTFQAQADDNSPAFSSIANNISNRSRTAASVLWPNVPAWNLVDAKQQTPNLAPVLQEIISRGGWESGNALVVLITGSGERTAESYEGEKAATPLLRVQYCLDQPLEQTPTSTPQTTPTGPLNMTFLPVVSR